MRPQSVRSSFDDGAVIAASQREPERFRVVFDRHYERVRRYAWARIGSAGEDVAAEVFAIAFERRERYDTARADAVPWLLGIATNLIRGQYRHERRRLRTLAALGQERQPGPDGEADPSAVASALTRLHRRDRDVLTLYAIEDLSYAQIAEALGIPEGTVRSRLNRARRIVQEAMTQ
jgi:RNA polymerase sigma factor (sigma-70 family)